MLQQGQRAGPPSVAAMETAILLSLSPLFYHSIPLNSRVGMSSTVGSQPLFSQSPFLRQSYTVQAPPILSNTTDPGFNLHLKRMCVSRSDAPDWRLDIAGDGQAFALKKKGLPSSDPESFTPGCIDFLQLLQVSGRKLNWKWQETGDYYLFFHLLATFQQTAENLMRIAVTVRTHLKDCSDFGFSNNIVLQCERLHSLLWFYSISLCIYESLSFFPLLCSWGYSTVPVFLQRERTLGHILLDILQRYFTSGIRVRYQFNRGVREGAGVCVCVCKGQRGM